MSLMNYDLYVENQIYILLLSQSWKIRIMIIKEPGMIDEKEDNNKILGSLQKKITLFAGFEGLWVTATTKYPTLICKRHAFIKKPSTIIHLSFS